MRQKSFFGENHPSNSSQNQQPVRTAGTCPNCGAELEPGAEYCKKCGYPVEK
ncbi:MAG: zinc-ribbon domain-containing protein [Lachnospiraceae bacterium]